MGSSRAVGYIYFAFGALAQRGVQLPLPTFVGPIPNPRPASQRPVRRDGGEETELKILTRGVPEQIMIEEG